MRHLQDLHKSLILRMLWLFAALALLLMSASCASATSTAFKSPTPVPTITSYPTLPSSGNPTPITGLLAPPPTSCPKSAPLQTYTSSNFGGGFVGTSTFAGASPVWQMGLSDGSDGPLHLNLNGASLLPQTKIMWVVGPNYKQPVILRGHNLSTGAPVWFDVYGSSGSDSYTQAALLDPGYPNRGDTLNSAGVWNIWGIGLTFLSAGCYELDVSWSQGSWSAIYAVGR